MDVFEAVQTRRSVRAYLPKPVPKEALERILEAAHLSPSASNRQPWHFIVVTDEKKRKEIAKGGMYGGFIAEAPVVIVGCGDTKASSKWFAVDVTIALQSMVLTATAEGLGTCWVGSFDEDQLKGLLKIPEHFRVVALLSVGYPREAVKSPRKRKELSEIASLEEFGNAFPQ
jgi:nitroreductase